MKSCLTIHGRTFEADQKLRPGTGTPDTHWAFRLIDICMRFNARSKRWEQNPHLNLVWAKAGDVLSVALDRLAPQHCKECFEHVMEFVLSNDLTYEFSPNMSECAICFQHATCVSQKHLLDKQEKIEL